MLLTVERPVSTGKEFDFHALSERLDRILSGGMSAMAGDHNEKAELTHTPMHPTTRYILTQTSPLVLQGAPVDGHRITVTHYVEDGGIRQTMSVSEGNETHASYAVAVRGLFEAGLSKIEAAGAGALRSGAELEDAAFKRAQPGF